LGISQTININGGIEMTIPLIHEDKFCPGLRDCPVLGHIIEECHFCGTPTRYWHENTNNPVCPTCSKKHKVKELPDFGQKIRAEKRAKNKEAKCQKS
jgi:hypothetical protein